MFEKIVPIRKNTILGSLSTMSVGDRTSQKVETINKNASGTRGLIASMKVLFLPVFSLYDLKARNKKKIIFTLQDDSKVYKKKIAILLVDVVKHNWQVRHKCTEIQENFKPTRSANPKEVSLPSFQSSIVRNKEYYYCSL